MGKERVAVTGKSTRPSRREGAGAVKTKPATLPLTVFESEAKRGAALEGGGTKWR